MRKQLSRITAIIVVAVTLGACSPESGRARGGGPGASGDNIPAGGLVPASKVFPSDEDPG